MSPIEDEIRDALRSEASSLREVPPLSLPAVLAPGRSRPRPRAWRARWGAWLVPVAVAAVVVLVAAGLVAVRSLGQRLRRPGRRVPALSRAPPWQRMRCRGTTCTSARRRIPRPGSSRVRRSSWATGRPGKTIAASPLPGAKALSAKALSASAYGLVYSGTAVSGAADDRTFVVSDAVSGIYATGQRPGSLPPTGTWCGSFPVPPTPSG